MSAKHLPWFRFYTEAIDDEKLGLLAFEDRWHFVALLCLKGKGILDSEPDTEMLWRKAALKMGLTGAELEKVVSRLARMKLIDCKTLQPLAWNDRQAQSDSSTERTRKYREKKRAINGKHGGDDAETSQERPSDGLEEDTDTDTDKEDSYESLSPGFPDDDAAKPEKKPEAVKAAKPAKISKPDEVAGQVWADFLQIRKAKRSPLTATALAGIEREAAKAGIGLQQALEVCCESGWVGFKAEWYANSRATASRATTQAETAYQRSMRERMQEAVPAIARKAPGAQPVVQAAEFFETLAAAPALRIGG